MKKLFIILACLPVLAQAQSNVPPDTGKKSFYSKNFQVNYKTKSDVQIIGQNFLAENCMTGDIVGDDVLTHFSLPYKTTSRGCLAVTIKGDITIHAWDNKTGIEFSNLSYELPAEGGACAKTGPLTDLYDCSKCKFGKADLKERLSNYASLMATKYWTYISDINGPDGYKKYAYDYGSSGHFDYASYYAQKNKSVKETSRNK